MYTNIKQKKENVNEFSEYLDYSQKKYCFRVGARFLSTFGSLMNRLLFEKAQAVRMYKKTGPAPPCLLSYN